MHHLALYAVGNLIPTTRAVRHHNRIRLGQLHGHVKVLDIKAEATGHAATVIPNEQADLTGINNGRAYSCIKSSSPYCWA